MIRYSGTEGVPEFCVGTPYLVYTAIIHLSSANAIHLLLTVPVLVPIIGLSIFSCARLCTRKTYKRSQQLSSFSIHPTASLRRSNLSPLVRAFLPKQYNRYVRRHRRPSKVGEKARQIQQSVARRRFVLSPGRRRLVKAY